MNGDDQQGRRLEPVDAFDQLRVRLPYPPAIDPEPAQRVAIPGVPAGATVNGHVRPESPPGAVTGSVVVIGGPRPFAHAGVVTRVLAATVDAAAVVGLAVVLDLAAAAARFVWSPVDFHWPQPAWEVTVTALLSVAVVYLTIGWAVAGRTYGARLLGLRVLSLRHGLLGWSRSVLRAIACVLWPIGLLWCAVSPTRRSLQDLVFRTVVVYDAQPYPPVLDAGPSAPARPVP